MSILSCNYCGAFIDTDDDVEAYNEAKDKWACVNCRETVEDEEPEATPTKEPSQ